MTMPVLKVVSRRSLGPKQVDITIPGPSPGIGPGSSAQTITELPVPLNLVLYTGDSFRMTLTLTNADGTATNLTGAQVLSQIRPEAASGTVSAAFHIGIQGNVITMDLIPSEIKSLAGAYVFDTQVTYSDGWVQTLVAGPVNFTQDVSRIP